MKIHQIIYFCTVLFVLTGCSVPIQPDPIRLPFPIPLQGKCEDLPGGCPIPIIPKVGGSSNDWKYGRFCGKDYPDYRKLQLSREALIQKYYEVEPYDDIDKACRDHDVCWIYFGEGDGLCNEQFYENINYISDEFMYRDGSQRCLNITCDIESSFLSIFVPDKYHDEAKEWGTSIGKAISSGVLLTGVVIHIILVHAEGYPNVGERCSLDTLKQSR